MGLEQDFAAAAEKARMAIVAMPLGPAPVNPNLASWGTTGRHELLGWLLDIERCAMRGLVALGEAIAEPKTERGSAGLEVALWRADATIDKIVCLLGLALGAGVLKLGRRGVGVQFDQAGDIWRRVDKCLQHMASSAPAATTLTAQARALNEHPVRQLRNEVAHLLSQIPSGETGVQPMCSFDLVHHRNSVETAREWRLLYRKEAWGEAGIGVDAVWDRITHVTTSGYESLTAVLETIADLLGAAGTLQPPQVVRYDDDTHETVLAVPPGCAPEPLTKKQRSSVRSGGSAQRMAGRRRGIAGSRRPRG